MFQYFGEEGFLDILDYLWPMTRACYQTLFHGSSRSGTCRAGLLF